MAPKSTELEVAFEASVAVSSWWWFVRGSRGQSLACCWRLQGRGAPALFPTHFAVIGIGASAGDITPLRSLIEALPAHMPSWKALTPLFRNCAATHGL